MIRRYQERRAIETIGQVYEGLTEHQRITPPALYHRTRAQRWAARGRRCVAWVAILLLATMLGIGAMVVGAMVGGMVATGPEAPACQEDEPCWDWRTMGNRTRGVCRDGESWLESADGWFERGGRACEARR